jgi:transposase-like protein
MSTRCPRPAPIARSAFAGFSFPPNVIVLAVRWYLRLNLSNVRDILEESPNRRVAVAFDELALAI